MTDSERLITLERERTTVLDMSERARGQAEYARARQAAPLPNDAPEQLAATVAAAERDAAEYIERARELEQEIAGLRRSDEERRKAEERELKRAAFENAKRADNHMRGAARYERALREVCEKIATYGDVDEGARSFRWQPHAHFAAMHAAGLETDATISPQSFLDRLRAIAAEGGE